MSEWFYNQNQTSSSFRKLLQERIDKTNPWRELTSEETKRLAKLEAIAEKLKRGENVVKLSAKVEAYVQKAKGFSGSLYVLWFSNYKSNNNLFVKDIELSTKKVDYLKYYDAL